MLPIDRNAVTLRAQVVSRKAAVKAGLLPTD